MLGPILNGQIVTLAPIKPEHLEHYVEWFADPQVTRFLGQDTAVTLQQEHDWLEGVARSEREVLWGIFVEGRHIGGTAVSRINWRHRHGMTGTMIGDRTWWGRGIATEAMTLRTDYAFGELGLEKLITQVVEDNVASRRALEKVGYTTAGIYRRHEFRENHWRDVWIGELLREAWQTRHERP